MRVGARCEAYLGDRNRVAVSAVLSPQSPAVALEIEPAIMAGVDRSDLPVDVHTAIWRYNT
jgi:hypothetical protein